MFNFRSSRPGKPLTTRREALECIPRKNIHVEEQRLPDGRVRLIYPIELHPRMARILGLFSAAPAPRQGKLELDDMGTLVWDLLDGHVTVRNLISAFAERYQTHPRETEVAMTSFLRSLGKKGLIGLQQQ